MTYKHLQQSRGDTAKSSGFKQREPATETKLPLWTQIREAWANFIIEKRAFGFWKALRSESRQIIAPEGSRIKIGGSRENKHPEEKLYLNIAGFGTNGVTIQKDGERSMLKEWARVADGPRYTVCFSEPIGRSDLIHMTSGALNFNATAISAVQGVVLAVYDKKTRTWVDSTWISLGKKKDAPDDGGHKKPVAAFGVAPPEPQTKWTPAAPVKLPEQALEIPVATFSSVDWRKQGGSTLSSGALSMDTAYAHLDAWIRRHVKTDENGLPISAPWRRVTDYEPVSSRETKLTANMGDKKTVLTITKREDIVLITGEITPKEGNDVSKAVHINFNLGESRTPKRPAEQLAADRSSAVFYVRMLNVPNDETHYYLCIVHIFNPTDEHNRTSEYGIAAFVVSEHTGTGPDPANMTYTALKLAEALKKKH